MMAPRSACRFSISPTTLEAVSRAMGPAYGAIPLVVRYSGLVFEQLAALTRRSCDPAGAWVSVEKVAVETSSGVAFKPLRRGYTVLCSLEAPASSALAAHLAMLKGGRDALVFTDGQGRPLRRAFFDEAIWRPALVAVGLEPAGHDLEQLALDRLRASWADKATLKRRYEGAVDPGGRSA